MQAQKNRLLAADLNVRYLNILTPAQRFALERVIGA